MEPASQDVLFTEMDTQAPTGLPQVGDIKITVVEPNTEPLDARYKISPEQAAFFKAETRIDDDDDLKAHILKVQEKAYKIFPYGSIRWFLFLKPGIATLPVYESIIKLGQEHPDGILLDIGCCFGQDARRAVADGFPLKNVVTNDLKTEFHDLGHALFNTSPETYPVNFVPGDAFDPEILQVILPFDEPPLGEKPDLTTLSSLNPLAGRCSVIYASNFFHMFSEENQLLIAKALAGLLSPRPGSIICGKHAGNWQKGNFRREQSGWVFDVFQHSPESWNALWDGEVFPKGKVRVNTKIEFADELEFHQLQWSVVRL